MPGENLSTLDKIRIKIRRLTKSPSQSQLSDDSINDYVNNFCLYDFADHLKLTYLRTTLTFYTSPNIDVYNTTTLPVTDPLYNFKNRYQVVDGPMYISGKPLFFTQSREQFYAMHPQYMQVSTIPSLGNGITTQYSGLLSNIPVLANTITFNSIDANNNAIYVSDNGILNANGTLQLTRPNQVFVAGTATDCGFINPLTGVYTVKFPVAPANQQKIFSQTYAYAAAWPQTILFYDTSFRVRPVPDMVYTVNMEVYRRPSAFLSDTQEPELAEWWQYIAYGAAKKVFEDRMDPDSVQIIMPEFKKQEELILNRVAAQQSDQRVPTIYTENSNLGSVFYFNNGSY